MLWSCSAFILPHLDITRARVLRADLRAHREHTVDQDAQAADWNNVPAAVLQVAPNQVDTDSDQDVSIATGDSENSDSTSESECSALDSEQYAA